MEDRIFLNDVHIANYKSLVNTDLKLHRELTALIGINGSGKTNTLAAIKLLRQVVNGRMRHAAYGFDDFAKSTTPMTELIASFEYKGNTFKLKAEIYLDNVETDDNIKFYQLFLKMEARNTKWAPIESDAFDYIDYFHRTQNGKNILMQRYLPKNPLDREFIIELSTFLRSVKYYGATVFSDPSKSPISFELEDDRHSRSSKKYGHQQFLYDLYILKQNDKKAYQRYINAVSKLGVDLVDGINFSQIKVPNSSVKIKAGGQTEKITSNRVLVVPIFTIGALQLSPNQLSEGTFKTLALIFYILNDESRLMLIEEPEVCVHHGLLANVIELIKQQSKRKQIVVSTHSDYVLDKLKPENISLVKRTVHGTTVEPLEDALSKDDYKALKLYLDESGNLGEYWKEDGFSFK